MTTPYTPTAATSSVSTIDTEAGLKTRGHDPQTRGHDSQDRGHDRQTPGHNDRRNGGHDARAGGRRLMTS